MLSRRMIPKEDESSLSTGADAEVTREDQDRINRFSRLHQREKTLVDSVNAKTKEKETLTDLSNELDLALLEADDDDDGEQLVPYKIGDAFHSLPLSEAQSLLETSSAKLDADIESLEADLEGIREEMKTLKAGLYARFGRGINLEG